MVAYNRPMLQRPLLVAFHGHSRKSPMVGHMYKRSPLAGIRDNVIDYFSKIEHSSVGPPVRSYFKRMGSSRFCLVPAGLTAWTIHLYESFFFGCIPVILSDEVSVPFQEEVDWPSLSLKVPVNISMAELHQKLKSFSAGRLKAMYAELKKARCWFDYSAGWGPEGYSESSACSPYLGLMKGLAKRAAALRENQFRLPLYWEPPPRT
eukprot:TRINITY_DN89933_c0_g1_i1.p1 TRINITY_DN89933_c0_g1~~TRINITY_DN89933_c0_g1_i1.p1  ORF type:complete len:229 (-),score=35.15 TRINITY_DN89933_c0_g1_i1:112-729(-)